MVEYNEKVMDYLEYLGYPEYIMGFRPEDVARSIAHTIGLFWVVGESHRMCALAIFGMTFTYQIMRKSPSRIH